jgi:hypothetical protein
MIVRSSGSTLASLSPGAVLSGAQHGGYAVGNESEGEIKFDSVSSIWRPLLLSIRQRRNCVSWPEGRAYEIVLMHCIDYCRSHLVVPDHNIHSI